MDEFSKLITKAKRLTKKQGFFLLHYDVVGSRNYAIKCTYERMYFCLESFQKEANKQFKLAIVPHKINPGRELSKFQTIIGDCGGAYFSVPEAIKPLAELGYKMLPFLLRWGIAKDGYDKKSFKKENMIMFKK